MSRLVLRSLAVLAAAGLLGACSSMPEWTKPTTWIDGVTDSADAEKAKPEAESAKTEVAQPVSSSPVIDPLEPEPTGPRIKVSDKPTEFPNLAAQPDAREASTTESQRREIRDSLVADRDRAQHTADELRGGTAPAAAPPPPAAPKTVKTEEKPKDE
jgi:outer membrane biosynthesis protein TonB